MKLLKHIILIVLIASPLLAIQKRKLKTENSNKRLKSLTSSKADIYNVILETQIARNNGSWDQKGKLYTWSLEKPPVNSAIAKGMCFSTNFAGDTVNHFVSSKYNNQAVYYMPYKNMGNISCNSSGINRLQFFGAMNIFFDFWVDLWQGDCEKLANTFNNNRNKRIQQIMEDVEVYGKYAGYVSEYHERLVKTNTENVNYDTLIADAATKIKNTETLIKTETDNFNAASSKLNEANKVVAELEAKNGQIGEEIKLNDSQIAEWTEIIDSAKNSMTSKSQLKENLTNEAENSMKILKEIIAALNAEAPNDAELITGALSAVEGSKDLEGFKGQLGKLLPA